MLRIEYRNIEVFRVRVAFLKTCCTVSTFTLLVIAYFMVSNYER